MIDLAPHFRRVCGAMPTGVSGCVVESTGSTVVVAGLPAPIGASCVIQRAAGEPLMSELIGFRDEHSLLFPLDHVRGVQRGDRVHLLRTSQDVPVGAGLLGRVVNATGQIIDGQGPGSRSWERVELDADPPPATERPPIEETFVSGIRPLDTLLTCGVGQRMGIFAPAGVGKSMLLGMLAQQAQCDVIVISLIGERGREVNEFIQKQLTPTSRQRSVIVVATGDQPALLRVRAAMTATAIAESFRAQGRQVLLLMDSLTRFSHAAREVAIAAGEPTTKNGFPPSVFARLARIIERTGRSPQGDITSFYTVLNEAELDQDPIAEAVRGFLDGHVVLSRQLAEAGHYPAIQMTKSVSRVMRGLVTPEHTRAAEKLRKYLSLLETHADLISLGAYRSGSQPDLDRAIQVKTRLRDFLRQDMDRPSSWNDSVGQLLNFDEISCEVSDA